MRDPEVLSPNYIGTRYFWDNSSPAHRIKSADFFGVNTFNVFALFSNVFKRNFFFAAIFILTLALNFYHLDTNPPGLYIDEVSIGVNAYSILKTGRDEYGVRFPVYFRSLGDYKLPVYIYLTSLSMSIFGKTEFAVRFPSAFLGSLSIIVLYLMIREILEYDAIKNKFSLLFAFLLSVSPWFLQFVGPAFEVTVAFFFFYLACYLFLISRRKNSIFVYCFSLLCFVTTVYTYHSYKIVTPIILLLILFVTIYNLREKKTGITPLILLLLFSVPILYSYFPSSANTRFLETSAFTTISANDVIIFLKNYISYFSSDFLFNFGDGIGRHQFLNFGLLARWTAPFLLIGLFLLLKKKRSYLKYAVLGILLVAPIPAALALPSPHSLRSLMMVVPYIIFISYGIIFTLHKSGKYMILFAIAITLIFAYEFSIYTHYSFFHYPKTSLLDWGGSFKEVTQETHKLTPKYSTIVVHESLPAAIVYLHFYDENLKVAMIKTGWKRGTKYRSQPALLITSDNNRELPLPGKLIGTVYLPNVNKNIFAQFWEI